MWGLKAIARDMGDALDNGMFGWLCAASLRCMRVANTVYF